MVNKKDLNFVIAHRTAFLARFIFLRSARKSRSHRIIEHLVWEHDTSTEELIDTIYKIFNLKKESLRTLDKDVKQALMHASRGIDPFIDEYLKRASSNFVGALCDFYHSNAILFTDDEEHPNIGWRKPKDILAENKELQMKLQRQD